MRRPKRFHGLQGCWLAGAVLLLSAACGGAGLRGARGMTSLAPYVESTGTAVEEMLQLAGVSPGDVVYDLGSGDGRIVIMAAKLDGARGVGFELDADLIRQSTENARRANVTHLVEFR